MKQYPHRPTYPDCECGHWKISHKDGTWLVNSGECRICMCPKYIPEPSNEIPKLENEKQ